MMPAFQQYKQNWILLKASGFDQIHRMEWNSTTFTYICQPVHLRLSSPSLSRICILLSLLRKMALEFNMPLVRHFLRSTNFSDGFPLLDAACNLGEPAAVQLLLLCLKVRNNPRTRRTFAHVCRALAQAKKVRWLNVLARHIHAIYANLRAMSIPMKHKPAAQVHLSRRQQRRLLGTGMVYESRLTLKQKACGVAKELNNSSQIIF